MDLNRTSIFIRLISLLPVKLVLYEKKKKKKNRKLNSKIPDF